MDTILVALGPLMGIYAGEYGCLAAIIGYMGTARLIVKPLQGLIQSIVDATPTPRDNAKWDAFRNHKVTLAVLYVLEWGSSIKIASPPPSL